MSDDGPLSKLLGSIDGEADRDTILSLFLDYVIDLGLEPYPAQEEAILELLSWKHVILNTPTGSGKSLVALALHFQAMAEGRVSFYTAPTKALVNEKFFALCEAFGPDRVGLLTGDASVNREAPIICCTAEILSNMALRQDDVDVDYVVMDEFHYYGDAERGAAWQIPLITMKDAVFLLMSATLGQTSDIERRLQAYTDRDVSVVRGGDRPVPLEFEYRDTPLQETIEDLLESAEAPIYLVNFTQRACAEQAQNLMSINVCSKEDKARIGAELEGTRFDTPYGKEFQRFIRHGLGVHHGGLLPRYRRVVERLSQTGLIKVISGTDTLGVGVNIPIRTVVIRQLFKFDGVKTALLTSRQFHQIAGRAGRKGFDDHGRVVVQAPEWAIENKKIDQKIRKNPNLKKKLVRKGPPRGAVPWDEQIFRRINAAPPEPLSPQLQVTHGSLVNLLQSGADHRGGGYGRLIELIGRSHASDKQKKTLRRRAAALFRSLRQAGIVEVRPGDDGRPEVIVREALQKDFSLHQTLSLYLVQTLDMLDEESESHALDVLTLVEAILEDPRAVLYRQVDKLKGELVGRLKAEGVDYEDRMKELDKVEHPKPNEELINETFEAFRETHPWVEGEDIHPKSVAREMYEGCHGFNDYVQLYGLARSEGVLLRYLAQTYKTAVQSIPVERWTEDIEDILAFLHGLVRRTDSSLVEEWELLVAAPSAPAEVAEEQPRQWDILDDERAFHARLRNELHVLLKALADENYTAATELLFQTDENTWNAGALEGAMAPYFREHVAVDVTPRSRQPGKTTVVEEGTRVFHVMQTIVDPDGDEDWMLDCVVDLSGPRDISQPLIELRRIGV